MHPYERLVNLQTDLSEIIAKCAAENRQPSTDEGKRIGDIQTELKAIRTEWESAGRTAFLAGLTTKTERPLAVLKSDQRFADVVKGSYPADFERLSLGKILRGYMTGDWSNAELEMKAMSSTPSAGGVLIPAPLSARVIDIARNRAVAFRAGAATVPMATSTLKLAKLTTDITAGWYAENATISEADAAFDSVTFTARKMATIVRVANELLEDAEGVDAVIEESIGMAIALELDRVALRGSGTAPEPRGVYNVASINTVTSVGTPANYDKFVQGIYAVRGYNFEPNAIVYSSRTGESLAKLKTGLSGDNTPLVQPADMAALAKLVTNSIPNNLGGGSNESFAILAQWNQLLIGLRREIRIEISREADDAFHKDQTLIRATWRGDVQHPQPKAYCVLDDITA